MDELNDPRAIEWLLKDMATEVYPTLERRNADGHLKAQLNEIDTCMESGCPCWDFDWAVGHGFISKRCWCGHRYAEHRVTGDYHWIIGEVVAELIRENGLGMALESESSSESDSDDSNERNDNDPAVYDSDKSSKLDPNLTSTWIDDNYGFSD